MALQCMRSARKGLLGLRYSEWRTRTRSRGTQGGGVGDIWGRAICTKSGQLIASSDPNNETPAPTLLSCPPRAIRPQLVRDQPNNLGTDQRQHSHRPRPCLRPSSLCSDIANCRTQNTIVWSSLVTILAWVWTAVHRNVPEPEQAGESRLWRYVDRVLEAAKIVVVTLLVPEWVLAWAVRQFLIAREVRKELEEAISEAEWKWREKEKTPKVMLRWGRGGEDVVRDRPGTTASGDGDGIQENIAAGSATPSSLSREQSEDGDRLAFDEWTVAVNKQIGRLSVKCTTRHGFLVTMGGFHYYKNGAPQHPLSRKDVVELVRRGDLILPTEEEIRGWSQSDALSKALAVVQALWFVVQAIARCIEGLPITQLEIMTLAYTTITVAMYVAWWDKPQNIGGPVRVAVHELPVSWAQMGLGGGIYRNNSLYADVVALLAAMLFGAVHCAAWHYVFPSGTERIIWRVSSLAIVALPVAMLVPVLLELADVVDIRQDVFPIMFALLPPIYVAARLFLLALSFTTLRSLPSEAYHAVQWTLLIPHFS
ncbi:hypothetical protein BV25DRAFT_1918173 [Artomyces pyxidatus]|uniref:Uncharacterized protein n=1 Tax=Artomyces pyxidatus TaxID=48021 RepID=A0ACB8SU64_9AGAM|nr:hypothetical protein BV25DRAFT_1918173 [Artomyces pyxidatus]